jgi:hypothetical protein
MSTCALGVRIAEYFADSALWATSTLAVRTALGTTAWSVSAESRPLEQDVLISAVARRAAIVSSVFIDPHPELSRSLLAPSPDPAALA